jgi:deoxyribose-phosphate aldolase
MIISDLASTAKIITARIKFMTSIVTKPKNINHFIDHTALKHEDFKQDILLQLAKEALDLGFNSICIRPEWLKDFLGWSKSAGQKTPKISFVMGFPQEPLNIELLGLEKILDILSVPVSIKLEQAQNALGYLISAKQTHIELDPVLDISGDKQDLQEKLSEEISSYIIQAMDFTKNHSELTLKLKPIFSSELLIKKAQDEGLEEDFYLKASVEALCQAYSRVFDLSQKLFLSYKNSTGFINGPDLQKGSWGHGTNKSLIARIAKYLKIYEEKYSIKPYSIGIKASAGIKTYQEVIDIIADSDTRLTHIGTSNGVEITQKVF